MRILLGRLIDSRTGTARLRELEEALCVQEASLEELFRSASAPAV